jgi:hypothetical protein
MNSCQNPNCNKLFIVKPGCYGKYCSLSCGTTHRSQQLKIKRICEYANNPCYCKECGDILSYENKKNSFCCKSCAAKFNNAKKDFTKFKTGPKKGKTSRPAYTKISQCVICNKFHPKSGKTCSSECFSKHVSNRVRGKTGGNRDINLPGVDCNGKKFYFDSNWEIMLSKSLSENSIFWERPNKFILSNSRSYTPDFYLPDYDIYIDPKAKRPDYYRNSILKIEMFEVEYKTHCLVITNPKLLTWTHIQTMLLIKSYRS